MGRLIDGQTDVDRILIFLFGVCLCVYYLFTLDVVCTAVHVFNNYLASTDFSLTLL